uniref:Uncharacterized protein n=1 Tax=Arundo donax TaxID=35708 RepID=A0A0A9DVK3_ARUDO
MHNRSAPILIQNAFSSGRKRRIDPFSFLCALRPSSNRCLTIIKHCSCWIQLNWSIWHQFTLREHSI